MNLSDRIRIAMEKAGLSQADLARACGVSAPSVHGWLSGRSKFLRGENLLQAARALNVNQDWLATGSGPMEAPDEPHLPPALRGLPPGTFRSVIAVEDDDPRLTLIPKVKLNLSAGISGVELDAQRFDGSTVAIPTEWLQRKGYVREQLIATDIRGASMEPTLHDGDRVVINTADKRPVDGGVFAINYEGEPVVKRLTRDAGQWWLTSDNPDQRRYHRKLCEGDACIIVGRVIRKESDSF